MFVNKRSIFATTLLLTFFSAFSSGWSAAPGQVLGAADLNFPSSSGFGSLVLAVPAPFPGRVSSSAPAPAVSARAVLVLDRVSRTVLFEKNAREPLPPASTTKIMTAVIALEKLPLDEVVTVGGLPVNGSSMGLTLGEQIKVRDLLWGLLLNSGNDAAVALARSLGGEGQFVRLMNQKAAALGLVNTHFENPVGFDQSRHYSSALDLALLADYALKKPFFARAVGSVQKLVQSFSRTYHKLDSTNQLLGKVAGVKGVKTGWTEAAGECLVVLVEREKHPVLITILGSKNREADAKKLIEWTFQSFDWGDGHSPSSATHSVGRAGT